MSFAISKMNQPQNKERGSMECDGLVELNMFYAISMTKICYGHLDIEKWETVKIKSEKWEKETNLSR